MERAFIFVGALFVASCKAPPPRPFEPPRLELSEGWFAGSPLSGPVGGETLSVSHESAYVLELKVFALESFPANALGPLASSTSFRIAVGAPDPIQTIAALGKEIRVAVIPREEALLGSLESSFGTRAAEVASARGVLCPGATWTIRCPLDAEGATRERFELAAWRARGGGPESAPVRLAITREGPFVPQGAEEGVLAAKSEKPDGDRARASPGEATGEPGPSSEAASASVRETSILEAALGKEDEALVVIVPTPRSAPAAALAFTLNLIAPPGEQRPDPGLELALERMAFGLSASSEAERARRRPAADRSTLLREVAEALDGSEKSRALIVFLAKETGASVASDIALSATAEVLASIAKKTSARLRTLGPNPGVEDLGWALEAGTLEAVGGLAGEESPDAAIAGILALHLGQVGRQSGAIERALQGARNLREFEARLIEGNRVCLEDSLPQTRARAFDWLAARGLAPQGYDPLAGPRERRAALERATQAAQSEALKE